ncbi:hypothetical protein Tco_0530934 [Tanacetum coccineum]
MNHLLRELVQSYDPPLLDINTSGSEEDSMEHQDDLTVFVPPTPYDSPLSGGSLPLGNFKGLSTIGAQQVDNESRRLKKKQRARTLGMKLFKIGDFDDDFDDIDDMVNEVMDNVDGDTINAAGVVNTATTGVSAISASVTTTGVSIIRRIRKKGKGVAFKAAQEESARPTRILPTIDPKDKEEQVEFEREQRIARERVAEQEAKDAALIEQMEDIQARMDADELLAERLQQEEREQFTIEEKSRMLVEMIAERKRFFAAQRAEQIRNKPPTRAQLRNKMVTYLKHIGKYTHNQMKSKSFEEIQKLYEKEQKWINDFVPMDSEVVKDSRKGKAKGSRKKTVARKRTGEKLDNESVKRQKIENDTKKEELRAYLDIIPGDDEAINVESLATKYPIVDWKTHALSEDRMYYEIIRGDESTKFYKIFIKMLDDFDRQDVLDLYRLVKERFETASLEGYDRIAIHMLIEKTYPLTQEMLSRLLSRRLEVNHECEMAYALLRIFGMLRCASVLLNGSDEYAYPVLEWIGWVLLPSIGMDRMGTPTQYWNGLHVSVNS